MNFEFNLPDIGEGLAEGEIVKWFVQEGDSVRENQPLVSVLTDKAEVEIPCPKTGKVVKLFGKPGQKAKVHAPLALFETSGAAPALSAPAAARGGEYVFNLPDIGEGLVEGELVKWHAKVGDSVSENQALASVLTDKAEVEIPSPKTGTIAVLHAEPGRKVKVHAPLVTFSDVAGGEPAPAKTASAAAAAPAAALSRTAPGTADAPASPMLRKLAKELGVDIGLVAGSGPEGRVLEADLRGFKGGSGATREIAAAKANATAAVKALALELGVDITRLTGTGPGGRVVEGDVRAASPKGERRAKTGRPAAAQAADGPPTFTPASPASSGVEKVPFVGIRRKIAEKMALSKRTVADVTHVDECDMTALLALREELKPAAAARAVKLTFLPFIIRALVKALAEYPMFNSSLDEAAGEILVRRDKNIGVAVAAPQGLLVPNIKGADGKDLFGLAAEVAALAEKVRSNTIDVAALKGGTFTITNIGPIGGLYANPIVNHPEVAILGLMKLRKRPMFRDGGVFIRDMMNLCLSFDHRVVDGADAANFMNTLIRSLENPRTLL